jgi:hypothetical protein
MRLLDAADKKGSELARIRAQRAALLDETATLDNTFSTVDEALTRFKDSETGVRLSSAARMQLEYLCIHGMQFQMSQLQENPVGLLMVLLGDEFDKRLSKVLSGIIGATGTTRADLFARDKALAAQVRELEIAEEREVMKLEDEGYAVGRRSDINPELIWEVWIQ